MALGIAKLENDFFIPTLQYFRQWALHVGVTEPDNPPGNILGYSAAKSQNTTMNVHHPWEAAVSLLCLPRVASPMRMSVAKSLLEELAVTPEPERKRKAFRTSMR
jgi:hypothetical protein